MLDKNLETQLQAYLQKLTRPVHILANTDGGEKSVEMLQLLRQIDALSPKIEVIEGHDSSLRAPSFALTTPDQDIHLRFAGIPLGHEFTSLVLALLQVGGHPLKLSDEQREQIAALDGDFEFETYFSLSCQNCPDVVQALNLMAVINPRIRHTAIDGALFQDEVNRREIMSVPAVFLNGEMFASGRMGVDEFVAKLDSGAAAREAQKISEKEPFDVLVVGGGPAGAAAAIYAARKGIRTGIATQRFGGQVLDTMGIENFISVPHTEGPRLVAQLEQHVSDYDVDIMPLQEAQKLVPGDNGLHSLELAGGGQLSARSVIISTGARWRQMNVPGEDEYRNKGVAYCPHCDGPLFKGKPVAVIGGGNSGVEAAIDLAGIVSHVTLLEFDDKLRADAVLQDKLRSLSNVTILTSAMTTEVLGDGRKVTGLRYQDRASGDSHDVALDGIFVQIGLLPNSDWLKGTLELSERGEIVVDARGQTSIPGVFAAGDATTVPYKQIVIAMGDGAKASLSAFDHLIRSAVPEQSKQRNAA